MSKRIITLGELETGGPAKLDVDRLVESRCLIQANSGGGKSWTLRRLLEQTHGLVQHLVLDVEGEFHTLREKYDYVLAAPTKGDCLAHPRTAPLLARRLLELGVSAVCDIYELPRHEQIRFVKLFLEAIISAPRELWHPALIVVDEAHLFCPQTGSAESSSAVTDLMTRGRKRGFCGVLATQRLSKLHKDAAAEANVKLIGRAALDVDMKRASEELGLTTKEEQQSLRSLSEGRFYAFGPGLSDRVVRIQVGSVETTHPRPGARATPIPAAREKVKSMLAQLVDLPKEAEEEARSIEDLRKQVTQLKRELAAKPAPATPKLERVEVPMLAKADIQKLGDVAAEITKAVLALSLAGDAIRQPLEKVVAHQMNGRAIASAKSKPLPTGRAQILAARVPVKTVDTSDLPKGQRDVLTAIAQQEAGADRQQLTVLTGYKRSTRDKYIYLLTERGAVRADGDRLFATDIGLELLGHGFEPLPRGEALREHWLRKLPEGERAVLEVVLANHPAAVDREQITEATGYKRSTRDKYLYLLANRRLVDSVGPGEVRASPTLFD